MTNKGGFVVSPREQGAPRHRHDSGPFERVDQGQQRVMVLKGGRHQARYASPSSRRSEGQHDVVFTFYGETWTDAQRREMYMAGDRLLQTLMDSAAVRRLLVANPYRSAPIQWARRLAGHRSAPFPGDSRRMLVEPRRIRHRDPTSVRALERAFAAYDRTLERRAVRLGACEPAVITTNPFVAGFAPLRWARRVTFYAWDDWMSGYPVRRWWPAYREAYARVRHSGRRVIAVSPAIIDRIMPTGPSAVVPNGVAPEEWRSPPAPPSWFAALPSPRILYAGVVDDRLDLPAVRDVAARFPRGTVILLGPIGERAVVESLRDIPNVLVEPPVGRVEVASVVHAAETCIMPHCSNRLTAAMSPLKLYEYLAGGRPVVATDLPPVRAVDPRIVRVREGESFADGVSVALDRGPLTNAERIAFVEANSWQRRHDDFLALALGTSSEVRVLPAASGILSERDGVASERALMDDDGGTS
jgi:glycosyltransferase involved in cell wall biosynthesis